MNFNIINSIGYVTPEALLADHLLPMMFHSAVVLCPTVFLAVAFCSAGLPNLLDKDLQPPSSWSLSQESCI